jgi:chromosome segregation ATPase
VSNGNKNKLTYKRAFALWESERDAARELQRQHSLAVQERDAAQKKLGADLEAFDRDLLTKSTDLDAALKVAQADVDKLLEKLEGLRAEHAEAAATAVAERADIVDRGREGIDDCNSKVQKLDAEHQEKRRRTDTLARQLPDLLQNEVQHN